MNSTLGTMFCCYYFLFYNKESTKLYLFYLCIDSNQFICSLQQFMESSTLGEFSTRLHLLSAFCTEMTQRGVSMLICVSRVL